MTDERTSSKQSLSKMLGKIGLSFSLMSPPKDEFDGPMAEKTIDTSFIDENGEISSIARSLMGPIGALGEYFFPPELVGGCCPRVAGEEEEIAWHAAAEAVDSERIHIVWQTKGDKVWYLAIRSSELSSESNTWCPFASLLPGMKDAVDPPVCYTYYSDESATMMTVSEDRLQIHRGTSSVVRAKAERVSRELGNAPVIDLIPDRIAKLTPIPWYSLSLFEARARRVLAAVAVAGGLAFAGLCIFVWLFATMATVAAHSDRDSIQERTENKSLQLMKNVQALRASPMREQLGRFADLNDGLITLNGMLEIYQIKDNKVLWRAVVPPNITSDRISELGGQTLDSSPQKVIIGNSRDALDLGKK